MYHKEASHTGTSVEQETSKELQNIDVRKSSNMSYFNRCIQFSSSSAKNTTEHMTCSMIIITLSAVLIPPKIIYLGTLFGWGKSFGF